MSATKKTAEPDGKSALEAMEQALGATMDRVVGAEEMIKKTVGATPPARPAAKAAAKKPTARAAKAKAASTDADGGGTTPPSGNNGGGDGHGGGHGNNGGKNKTLWEKFDVLIIIAVLIVLYTAAVTVNSYIERTASVDSVVEMQRKINASGIMDPIQNGGSRTGVARIINVPTFACGTPKQREDGFARNEVRQLLQSSASYPFVPGCGLFQIGSGVTVTDLDADNFIFELDGRRGFGCGTQDAGAHKPYDKAECVRFLNENRGQRIRVYIRSYGRVNIKS